MAANIKTPLYFRLLGRLRHYIDSFPYGEFYFSRLAKQELSFVQAGANCSNKDLIYQFGKRWKGYLLEPLPMAYEALIKNFPHRDNKFIEQIALSDHDGTIKLYCPKKTEDNKDWYTLMTSSDRNNYYLKDMEVDEFEVPCYTLDTFLSKKNIKELDLLYMNIEGHEFKVLNAYSFRVVPKIMWLETRFYNYNDTKNFYEKMIDLGYRIFPKKDFCLLINKNN